jgi:hypothetical protein
MAANMPPSIRQSRRLSKSFIQVQFRGSTDLLTNGSIASGAMVGAVLRIGTAAAEALWGVAAES